MGDIVTSIRSGLSNSLDRKISLSCDMMPHYNLNMSKDTFIHSTHLMGRLIPGIMSPFFSDAILDGIEPPRGHLLSSIFAGAIKWCMTREHNAKVIKEELSLSRTLKAGKAVVLHAFDICAKVPTAFFKKNFITQIISKGVQECFERNGKIISSVTFATPFKKAVKDAAYDMCVETPNIHLKGNFASSAIEKATRVAKVVSDYNYKLLFPVRILDGVAYTVSVIVFGIFAYGCIRREPERQTLEE